MKRVVFFSLLILAISGTCVQAQVPPASRIMNRLNRGNPPGQPPGPGPMTAPGANASTSTPPAMVEIPTSPLVLAMDTNHDNILSADEINNAPVSLKTLDKNGDGQLTPDEYLAAGEEPPGTSPLIKALDLNGDGVISAREISLAPSNLRVLDKNFDGKLGPGEYRPPAGTMMPAKAQQTTNSPSK